MTDFNILCDRLPDSVTVFGEKYPIKTDFRRWILMLDLFEQCKNGNRYPLDVITAAKCAIHIVMPDNPDLCNLPAFKLVRLLEELAVFASGTVQQESGTEPGKRKDVQVFDFSCDAELILASFRREYGIDLTTAGMHWWKFLALLRSLPSDSDFMRIVSLRLCDTTKIADDELRRKLRRAKAAVRIKHKTGFDE